MLAAGFEECRHRTAGLRHVGARCGGCCGLPGRECLPSFAQAGFDGFADIGLGGAEVERRVCGGLQTPQGAGAFGLELLCGHRHAPMMTDRCAFVAG